MRPTQEQLGSFREQGYLLVPSALTPTQASALCDRADILAEHAQTKGLGEPWFSILHPALASHYEYDLVNCLASDRILGFCRELVGYDFKIGWTYQLVLNSKGGAWHHDSQFASRARFAPGFSMERWRDEAPFSQHTVRVALTDDPTAWLIPETHRRELTAAERAVVERKEFDPGLPGSTNIVLKAGDMLMYHRTILHGGTPIAAGAKRRTLYWTWVRHDRFDPLYTEDPPLSAEQRRHVDPQLVAIDERTPH